MAVIVDYDGRIETIKAKGTQTVGLDTQYGLDTIYITAAGFVNYPIYGASPESELGFIEPVWGSELERSTNLVLANILDVNYGLVARIEVTFPYLNIETYRNLCKIIKERVCKITYFDRETAEWVQNQEFAVTQTSIGQLYNMGNDYFGVREMSVSFVATNRDKADLIASTFAITYYAGDEEEPLTDKINKYYLKYEDVEQVVRDDDGNEVVDDDGNIKTEVIQQVTSASQAEVDGYTQAVWGFTTTILPTDFMDDDEELKAKKFVEWNTKPDGTGGHYYPNEVKTMWEDMALYAIFEEDGEE